jgi:peptidoglycan/LPS O-acetylase OafA/YrhL
MLPVVHEPAYRMRSFSKYVWRRAKRILPPYYAALIVSLVLIAACPVLRTVQHQRWDSALPAFNPGVLASHVLVVHNWNPAWSSRIDPPMWSVAPEWQIYFLFPLVLLPLLRRVGMAGCAAIVLGMTSGLHFVAAGRADYLSPWFVGLFAVGMAAAVVTRSTRPEHGWWQRLPWGTIVAVGWCGVLAGFVINTGWMLSRTYASDAFVGLAMAATLVFCARKCEPERPGKRVVVGFLEWGPVVWLGTISYSLYLLHYPLLPLIHAGLRRMGLTLLQEVAGMFVGGIVVVLPLSYVFHRVFERPFMNFHGTERSTAISAAVNPAI